MQQNIRIMQKSQIERMTQRFNVVRLCKPTSMAATHSKALSLSGGRKNFVHQLAFIAMNMPRYITLPIGEVTNFVNQFIYMDTSLNEAHLTPYCP